MHNVRQISLSINGQEYRARCEPRENLADLLRHTIGLTGTHVGCEVGECGACTVLLDGEQVRACLVLAVQADAKEVVTVEGLSDGTALSALQDSFGRHHALQCGFCTPGLLVALTDLLAREPAPTEEVVRRAVAGHLCRCTGYQNVVDATLAVCRGSVPVEGETVRVEDEALLRGKGCFVDDLHPHGAVVAHFVRSMVAHARIIGIDVEAARKSAGVVAILRYEDLPSHAQEPLPVVAPAPGLRRCPPQYVLARDEVRYVGEPVAVVLAETRALAEDAAERVVVRYEPLPALLNIAPAVAASTLVRTELDSNLAGVMSFGFGEPMRALADADHLLTETFRINRGSGQPIECRGVVAAHDKSDDLLMVTYSGQAPHSLKNCLTEMLGRASDAVRVVTADVGGGFGTKGVTYPEDVVVPVAALMTGHPVKWTEDRSEHMVAAIQERDQQWEVTIAFDESGRIRGLVGSLTHDGGAYVTSGSILPLNSASTLVGPYDLGALHLEVKTILTNMAPCCPVRGAGRPQAVFVIERLLDRIAQFLGLDRAGVRRINLIRRDQIPYAFPMLYRNESPLTYETGDYPRFQREVLDRAEYGTFPERMSGARQRGRLRGIGIANYVEGTAAAPQESASVCLLADGKVWVRTGASSQGQSHRTTIARIVAAELSVSPADVIVSQGDTSVWPTGGGTFSSRTMVTVGSAVLLAARKLADAVRTGSTTRVEDLRSQPKDVCPAHADVVLEATANYVPDSATFVFGCHVAEIEIDPQIASVEVVRYTVAHDVGRAVHASVVEGQLHGGVAHGIGNALLERSGAPPAGGVHGLTLADYRMPRATDVPRMDAILLRAEVPTNPLGAGGVGEAGCIGAPAAVISAVEHALGSAAHLNNAPMDDSVYDAIAAALRHAEHSRDFCGRA